MNKDIGNSSADASKRQGLIDGRVLKFSRPKADVKESEEDRLARTIPASWLESLASDQQRTCRMPVEIEDAIIDGPLNMESVSSSVS